MKLVSLAFLVLFFNISLITSLPFRFLRHNPPPPPGVLRSSKVSEEYFTQKLDHFDATNETIWSQRYFVNTEYFNTSSNNVAFLMLGGEGEAAKGWMTYGSWIASAKKYGALLFQLEHRFYGQSQPFSDLATENLRYLSSEQALGDSAEFIKGMNKQYSLDPDVKWIVFGGSYSASLAAWLRLKYPDLVQGVMSASGPLLAKLDFSEYFQVVLDDLASYDKECVTSLTTAMSQVDDLLTNPDSNETLTDIFNLCDPIEGLDIDDAKVATFYNRLADAFAQIAQYNGLLDFTISDICTLMTDEDIGKEIYRLVDVTKLVYGTSCMGYNHTRDVEILRNTQIHGAADRQWYYQTCTEYGWYQSTKTQDNIWGRGCTVDYYTNLCSEVFGPEFNQSFTSAQIDKTNADYGGTDIDVSNVVYVHGSLDPWHAVGLTNTTNPDSPVIYIDGTSHCSNMYEKTDGEPPQLAAAREVVDRLIGVWLGIN